MSHARLLEPDTPMTRRDFNAWPDQQPPGHDPIALRIFTSGDIRLDPPGITVTVEAFYAD
jgi:hypothetical protein